MILRLTQKPAKKIKVGELAELSLDENPYADRSCHLFTADRTQNIIMSNTTSLYPALYVVPGLVGLFLPALVAWLLRRSSLKHDRTEE